MSPTFREKLSRLATPSLAAAADRITTDLAGLLALLPPQSRQEIVALVLAELTSQAGDSPAIPPDVLERARQQFSEEEIAAGLREIRETGGLSLADFYQELDPPAPTHE